MKLRTAAASFAVLIPSLVISAQSPSSSAPPLPSQLAAKVVFLGTSASPGFLSNQLNASLYTELYGDLNSAGYTVVDSPNKAVIALQTSILGSSQGSFLQVQIFDIATHTLLWTVEEPIEPAVRTATLEKNMASAAHSFVGALSTLSAGKMPN